LCWQPAGHILNQGVGNQSDKMSITPLLLKKLNVFAYVLAQFHPVILVLQRGQLLPTCYEHDYIAQEIQQLLS